MKVKLAFEMDAYNMRNRGVRLFKHEYSPLRLSGLTDFRVWPYLYLATENKHDRKTAVQIFTEDIAYWTSSDSVFFLEVLRNAGVKVE